uniref:Putative secreted protein n=1 Tax=Amblyomma triste TaxID=251400 RepID=A0A023G2R5_AMBTT
MWPRVSLAVSALCSSIIYKVDCISGMKRTTMRSWCWGSLLFYDLLSTRYSLLTELYHSLFLLYLRL